MNTKHMIIIGKPGPLASQLDAPYWEGLKHGEVRLQRCSACDLWIWAPQWRCGECGSWELEWKAVDPAGKVYSWTRTRQAFFPEALGATPYVTVLGELPGAGGRRILGILLDESETIEIGDPIVAVIMPPEAGAQSHIFRWKLLRSNE